jgi:hypothetical protein
MVNLKKRWPNLHLPNPIHGRLCFLHATSPVPLHSFAWRPHRQPEEWRPIIFIVFSVSTKRTCEGSCRHNHCLLWTRTMVCIKGKNGWLLELQLLPIFLCFAKKFDFLQPSALVVKDYKLVLYMETEPRAPTKRKFNLCWDGESPLACTTFQGRLRTQ